MKEVTQKDLPEVSGGEYTPGGCIPDPIRQLPQPDTEYPQDPIAPIFGSSIAVDA
jgi:hypothetical protein